MSKKLNLYARYFIYRSKVIYHNVTYSISFTSGLNKNERGYLINPHTFNQFLFFVCTASEDLKHFDISKVLNQKRRGGLS